MRRTGLSDLFLSLHDLDRRCARSYADCEFKKDPVESQKVIKHQGYPFCRRVVVGYLNLGYVT